jgi:S1-C subfamily serine protease
MAKEISCIRWKIVLPGVRDDFFGTGFIVGEGKILTNHHVSQRGGKMMS